MRLSEVWSLFSHKNNPEKFFTNVNFEYFVSFETKEFKIETKYYKLNSQQKVLTTKDCIPQSTFSAMLQSEDWKEA